MTAEAKSGVDDDRVLTGNGRRQQVEHTIEEYGNVTRLRHANPFLSVLVLLLVMVMVIWCRAARSPTGRV
jgi:hypothetical protein